MKLKIQASLPLKVKQKVKFTFEPATSWKGESPEALEYLEGHSGQKAEVVGIEGSTYTIRFSDGYEPEQIPRENLKLSK